MLFCWNEINYVFFKTTFLLLHLLLSKLFSFSQIWLSETALKLDSLVGDIEDAVSSAMSNNRRSNSTRDSEVST